MLLQEESVGVLSQHLGQLQPENQGQQVQGEKTMVIQ